jgi:lysophospholipid acyltransferase (LPLAT)-like uncharacterized protein
MLKGFLRRPGVQLALARLLGLYLLLVHRTSRWEVRGLEHLDAEYRARGAVIVAFWHENLPLMPELWRRARERHATRRAHVLVSQHRDGRLIGEVIRVFALDTVHGSTSKGGAAGMRSLLRLIAEGDTVAITPDGPRGPRREAAPGTAQLSALAGLPVLPCAARAAFGIKLRSWDRMIVPLPFGRVSLVVGPPLSWGRPVPEGAAEELAAALTAANDAADAALGVEPA